MKIQARTETLIAIPITEYQEGETLLIPAQNISENILCSNTVNQVHQNQILIAVINPTESSVELTQAQTKSISIYKFDEVNVYATQNIPEKSSGQGRLETLREKLNLDHLNQEERESLMPICEEYSNIFHLYSVQNKTMTRRRPVFVGRRSDSTHEHRSRDRGSGGMCTPREVDVRACVMHTALANVRMCVVHYLVGFIGMCVP